MAISGLTGPPSLHRGNRSGIALFVNGRWVQSAALRFAVSDAYQSELPGGRYPVASVALHLPAEAVDVNVHPAKAEVRFRDQRGVARVLRHAIVRALEGTGPVGWSLGEAPSTAEAPAEAPRPSLRERLQPPQPALGRELAPEASPAEAGRRTQRENAPAAAGGGAGGDDLRGGGGAGRDVLHRPARGARTGRVRPAEGAGLGGGRAAPAGAGAGGAGPHSRSRVRGARRASGAAGTGAGALRRRLLPGAGGARGLRRRRHWGERCERCWRSWETSDGCRTRSIARRRRSRATAACGRAWRSRWRRCAS